MGSNLAVAYRIVCWGCGQINHQEVPIVSKADNMTYQCTHCQKIIIEFHTHELDDEHEHEE